MKKYSLLFTALCFVTAVSFAHASDKEIVIFSGKDKFRDKWLATGWGGTEAKVIDGAGKEKGAAVSSVFTSETAPWSGISLQLAFEESRPKECIDLDKKLIDKGTVELALNCGKTKDGKKGGDQAVQIGIVFVDKKGERFGAPPIPMERLGKASKLDGSEGSWEELKLPIAESLKGLPNAADMVGIFAVTVQFVDMPLCEVLVDSCVISQK
jgi:hypothetical protein